MVNWVQGPATALYTVADERTKSAIPHGGTLLRVCTAPTPPWGNIVGGNSLYPGSYRGLLPEKRLAFADAGAMETRPDSSEETGVGG